MPKLTLEVPSDVVDALRFPPGEAEGEIRSELYRQALNAVDEESELIRDDVEWGLRGID